MNEFDNSKRKWKEFFTGSQPEQLDKNSLEYKRQTINPEALEGVYNEHLEKTPPANYPDWVSELLEERTEKAKQATVEASAEYQAKRLADLMEKQEKRIEEEKKPFKRRPIPIVKYVR